MAQRHDDDAFGFSAPPADALPAFFTTGSVDDKKYESLLEDLRAHDLLGPADADDATPALGGSSLFFNNAFSAAFLGNFGSDPFAESSAKPAASKPPPGFARAPPGLAPSETDLKWARGQQAFSQLASSASSSSAAYSKDDAASDVLDADEIPSLKALGLDDDDATPVQTTPAPSAIPPPPGAWQQPPPPPQYPPQQQFQQQQPFQPPPPPQQQQQQHAPPPPPQQQQHHHPYAHGPPPHMHPMHMPPPFGMGGPPPPPPPPPHMQAMRGPPGGMPYPPPMMQMPPPPPANFAPRFKMMTPRDINFVVQAQTKWIRSSDPFSDDYYFHNYVQKRSRGPVPRPGARGLPLPSWKLEHIKSVDHVDSSRAAKSREWENQHQVLGRNNTRSLYRPKQLLNLAGDDAPAGDADKAAAESSPSEDASSPSTTEPMVVKTTNEVFGSELWHKRQQIDRGLQCLLSLQDARHLLDARGINVQQFHSMNAQSMDPALAELRTRTTTLLLELAGLLGVAVPTETEAVACDVAQLHRVLSVAKGKRLVSRALPLLHPSARFVLLPHLVEALLSAPGVAKIEASSDDEDERLCQTLVLTLLYHPPAPSAELLTDCLARAMNGHDLGSLRVLLYNRGRAEALQALLQRGGAAVHEAASDATKQQWARAQEAFVALATAIKQQA